MKWAETILRIVVIGIIELGTVLFCAWTGEINNIALLTSSLGLGIIIWLAELRESGLIGQAIFIFVVVFHLYAIGQYVWYGGTVTGEFLLFGIGLAMSSCFGC